MKKHEFKEGDGMSKETSTPEERKEIYELLKTKGYNISVIGIYSYLYNFDLELLFRGFKELQSKLPVIELKGANKEINYVSRDRLTTMVYGYRNRPEANNIEWSDKKSCISLLGLNQSQLEAIKEMDWKESLHKVKHI